MSQHLHTLTNREHIVQPMHATQLRKRQQERAKCADQHSSRGEGKGISHSPMIAPRPIHRPVWNHPSVVLQNGSTRCGSERCIGRGQKRGDRKGETYTNGEKIGQSREVGGKMAHKVVCAYEMGKFSTTRFGGTGCAHVFQCIYCLPCESTSLCPLPFHPPARSCLHSR